MTVGELQLRQDVRHVGLDRLDTDEQLFSHLAIKHNINVVAERGRDPQLKLRRAGREVLLRDWANEIFEQMTAGYTDLRGYQGRVRRICARIDAEFVDPLPAILATGPSATTDFVPFDGHPTGRVYGAIAAAIAEHLGR